MAWGASLSERSRRDVEALADAGLRAAERALGAAEWLRPIPLALSFTGAVQELELDSTALPRRTPAALTSAAIYLLAQHAPPSRAVALVTASRLTGRRHDAVEVWVEHRDGAALTVLREFTRRGGRARFGEPRAYLGSPIVWATRAD